MRTALILVFVMTYTGLSAQQNLSYQTPAKEILDLVDVPLAPSLLMDDNKEFMVLRYRDAYKTIAELSKKEMRLGGLRIDPATNIGSRITYYNQIKIQPIAAKDKEVQEVKGLPANPLLANFSWSPDQKKLAFTHTTSTGVEVWVLEISTATAKRLTGPTANANMGDVINWFEDSQSILVKMISEDRKPLTGGGIPGIPRPMYLIHQKLPRNRSCCLTATIRTGTAIRADLSPKEMSMEAMCSA